MLPTTVASVGADSRPDLRCDLSRPWLACYIYGGIYADNFATRVVTLMHVLLLSLGAQILAKKKLAPLDGYLAN